MPWRGREETCEHARLAREWCARSTIQRCCQRVRHIVNYLSCKIVITAIAATLVLTLPAGVVTLHSACDPYGGWLPSRPCLSDAARPSRAPPPLSGGPCASDGRAGAGAHPLGLCKMPPLRAQLSRPAGWAQLEPEVQVDTLSPGASGGRIHRRLADQRARKRRPDPPAATAGRMSEPAHIRAEYPKAQLTIPFRTSSPCGMMDALLKIPTHSW